MVIEAMWVFGAEFQAWQAQRARPHHTHGQQFPFLLATHASTPIFHGSIPLRDREFPAEQGPIVPWIPKSRERRQLWATSPSFHLLCKILLIPKKSPGGFAPVGKAWRSVHNEGCGLIGHLWFNFWDGFSSSCWNKSLDLESWVLLGQAQLL